MGGSGVATVLRILACLHFQTLTPSKDTTACNDSLRRHASNESQVIHNAVLAWRANVVSAGIGLSESV